MTHKILPPFIVDSTSICHGVDSQTRVAIFDQTPNRNLLGFVLPEYAHEICQRLNEKPDLEAHERDLERRSGCGTP